MKRKHSFLYRNSLSLVLAVLFMISMAGQIVAGRNTYNEERQDEGQVPVSMFEYLGSGHFVQATFENWESEFLQMCMYVLLTVWLRQVGSSESKPLEGEEPVDREPDPNKKGAPWAVRRGGWVLALYKNSLSITFALLFIISFWLHAAGSLNDYNEQQRWKGKYTITMKEYLRESRFWFESFQNWQSEFVAVISIVVLSIFLRQKGSPESKPVDAGMDDTGGG